MGAQEVQSSPRDQSSVEQQIQILASAMKDMIRSELGTIRKEIQDDIEQGMSLMEARIKRCNVPNTPQSRRQVDR